MFVMTMKFTKRKAVLIIIAVAAVLAAVVIIAAGIRANSYASNIIKTNDDRVKYLQSLGWEVNPEPTDTQSVVIPREFSSVYSEYNALQKQQGFDLSNFCGMQVDVYTYEVTNYPGATNAVYAQIYVLNYQVIAGDIHSVELNGFMHGIL